MAFELILPPLLDIRNGMEILHRHTVQLLPCSTINILQLKIVFHRDPIFLANISSREAHFAGISFLELIPELNGSCWLKIIVIAKSMEVFFFKTIVYFLAI